MTMETFNITNVSLQTNCALSENDTLWIENFYQCSEAPVNKAYGLAMNVYVLGIICIFGIVGNVLSFIVMSREKTKTVHFYLLRSLAVADFSFVVVTFFLTVLPRFCCWTDACYGINAQALELHTERWLWGVHHMANFVSKWFMVLVAVERFIAMCIPYKYKELVTLRNARITIIAMSIFNVFYNLAKFFESVIVEKTRVHPCTNETMSKLVIDASELQNLPYYNVVYQAILDFTLLVLAPLGLLIFLNASIMVALKAQRRNRKRMGRVEQHENNVSLVLVINVLVFLVCNFPSLGVAIKNAIDTEYMYEQKPDDIYINYFIPLNNALVVLNSATNFIVYCIFGRKFRQLLWDLCDCCLPTEQRMRRRNTFESTRREHNNVHQLNGNATKDPSTTEQTHILKNEQGQHETEA